MVRLAREAARAGVFSQAEANWRAVLEQDPGHAEALFTTGMLALSRGDQAAALDLLSRSRSVQPRHTPTHLALATLKQQQGDDEGEMQCLEMALRIDPYFLPAMLAKAANLKRRGQTRAAAWHYGNALKVVPKDARLAPELMNALTQARQFVAANARALNAFTRERMEQIKQSHPGADLRRLEESIDIATGTRKRYVSEPLTLYFPRVPSVQFFDREDFAWVSELEAKTQEIKSECEALLKRSQEDFEPYVQFRPGMPVNQWADLNNSKNWSTYFLWKGGEKIAPHCEACPKTAAALEAVPMADFDGHSPVAMFSVLQPHTRIPPHTGETNARLVVHLPLIIPPACAFRVGNETREWREGQVFIFDDSIEHEAWNDSDYVRTVLIFDIWNPHLTAAERAGAVATMHALRDFYAA
ncbi:MAG: aspartyl/asparaginyl beta-hydroxylase domain-containing protein [Alphaproteobacteria bacterium]|nr:aspartyl/asparaginyl beta-hydroxylase domain-containing protein [Alphaproteobacteria bacterium]